MFSLKNKIKMWHEARKQEKKIRGLMVDYKKRAERRREYYEKTKADPAQFVRIFAQACKVHLDPAVAIAAESPQSMMPWQGDTSNMIDRFDVRAHLDIMPPEKSYSIQLSRHEEDEEKKANYERYRILVENECAGLTEEQALHQIYLDEQFGAINKNPDEEKNKLKDKKAAIGYTYEDSTNPDEDKNDDSDEEEEEEEDIETLDLDIALDVDTLNKEQMLQLNACGTQFGMGNDDYVKYLHRDKDEQEALKQAKQLEEEKAQFAGRKSRRERRIYKEKRLAGRKLSPPSYAARASPKYEPYRRSSSRSKSRSRSRTPPRRTRKLYITSFGDHDSDDGEGVVHGPALPPGLITKTESDSTNKKSACDVKVKKESLRQRLEKGLSPERSPRSRDRDYKSRRNISRSSNYKSGRSRSIGRRSRSRDRLSRDRRSRDRSFRSRSRERSRRSRERRSRNRRSSERSYRAGRSRSRSRSRRSRSRSRHSRSHDRKSGSVRYNWQRPKSRSKSRSRSSSSSKSRSKSRSSSRSSRSKSRSPEQQVIKRYRRESLSSKGSEDSDDESSKKTKNTSAVSYSNKIMTVKPLVPYGKSSSLSQPKLTPQEKLKRRMQIALNKQFKADKKAEILRNEKMEQEKMDREEELRQRALEMRRREREKRHREMEETYCSDSDSSDGSTPPLRSTNDKSPARRSKKLANAESLFNRKIVRSSRSQSRSSSRSRSRSGSSERKRIVDY